MSTKPSLAVGPRLHALCMLWCHMSDTALCAGGQRGRSKTSLEWSPTMEWCSIQQPTSMTGQTSGEGMLHSTLCPKVALWLQLRMLFGCEATWVCWQTVAIMEWSWLNSNAWTRVNFLCSFRYRHFMYTYIHVCVSLWCHAPFPSQSLGQSYQEIWWTIDTLFPWFQAHVLESPQEEAALEER